MSEWQPIETAPKDGSLVTTGKRSLIFNSRVFYPIASRFIDGVWQAEMGNGRWEMYDPQPDVWRPLSEPPK